MKKITLVIGLALALVLPATAGAKPTVDKEDKRQAKTECKTLRGHTSESREAFRTLYKNFAACWKAKAAEEAQQEETAHKNAAKECKAERDSMGEEAFGLEYGTESSNRRNAFGKCVSEKTHESETEQTA